MFSAYSWGDFFKVVIAILIPYYAFVFWKYYRHDFREWISSRGQKPQPVSGPVAEESADDEDDVESRFTTSYYDDGQQAHHQPLTDPAPAAQKPQRVEKAVAAEWLPGPPAGVDGSEIDMSGPDITQQGEETLGLPLAFQAENPEELLLEEVLTAAKRIKPDDNGRLVPVEVNDPVASRLAAHINNQQGVDEFSDMSFTR